MTPSTFYPCWAASEAHGLDFTGLAAALIVFTALCAYVNHKFLRLPPSVGVMAVALLCSLALIAVGQFAPAVERGARGLVEQIDFNKTVLRGMLGFLLFAGALHIELERLASRKWLIAVLATGGVLVTTLLVGFTAQVVLSALGFEARLLYCLMFGALIAPTDPVAVLAMLKEVDAPRPLEATIAGESLFNDGVGVAVFLALLQAAQAGNGVDAVALGLAFLREGLGGGLFGLVIGVASYYLIKSVDNYQVEVLLSLALVAGGYALAMWLHVSAPIAMVVAGLLIGNQGRAFAMSQTTREHLDTFWRLIDELLTALLFVLLGLEALALTFTGRLVLAGAVLVPVVLLARLASVAPPVWLLRTREPVERYTTRLLCWGGLRGGLSVAMALSVPTVIDGTVVPEREWILAATYIVVAFSVLVQGTTVGPLMRLWLRPPAEEKAAKAAP
jgi:CPA1 family monovalent cation:H+ antiporter